MVSLARTRWKFDVSVESAVHILNRLEIVVKCTYSERNHFCNKQKFLQKKKNNLSKFQKCHAVSENSCFIFAFSRQDAQ